MNGAANAEESGTGERPDGLDRPTVGVVLAGGTGTRLYPASRSRRPKQFCSFGRDRSLLAEAVDRLDFAERVYVLTRADFAEEVRERVPQAGVLVEPEPKDTGPALVYAAHRIRQQVGECVLVCTPSDHHVGDGFADVARTAVEAAVETGGLVTLGVEPDRPATGYGYVRPGRSRDGYFEVDAFVEKPDEETARAYVQQGHYWNAGIFAWTPAALLGEARGAELRPLVEALEAGDPDRGFAAVESVSVDYAVLERTDEAYVVPAAFEWEDLGSWDALERVIETDADGNAVQGEAVTIDAAGNVVATDGHVSLLGVEDLVVAAYGDRTLVVPKAESQRVREVVDRLRSEDLF